MASLFISIDLSNDAFMSPGSKAIEYDAVADAVASVAHRVRNGAHSGPIIDTNGNTVGRFVISREA